MAMLLSPCSFLYQFTNPVWQCQCSPSEGCSPMKRLDLSTSRFSFNAHSPPSVTVSVLPSMLFGCRLPVSTFSGPYRILIKGAAFVTSALRFLRVDKPHPKPSPAETEFHFISTCLGSKPVEYAPQRVRVVRLFWGRLHIQPRLQI